MDIKQDKEIKIFKEKLNILTTWASIFLIIYMIIFYIQNPKDDSDSENKRSGLKVMTDNLTGCQYLGYGKTFMVRWDGNDKQVGCKNGY